MADDLAPDVIEVTRILLDAVTGLLQDTPKVDQMPVSAVIYTAMTPEGVTKWDWKMTHDLEWPTVAGWAGIVERQAQDYIIDQDLEGDPD